MIFQLQVVQSSDGTIAQVRTSRTSEDLLQLLLALKKYVLKFRLDFIFIANRPFPDVSFQPSIQKQSLIDLREKIGKRIVLQREENNRMYTSLSAQIIGLTNTYSESLSHIA